MAGNKKWKVDINSLNSELKNSNNCKEWSTCTIKETTLKAVASQTRREGPAASQNIPQMYGARAYYAQHEKKNLQT